MPYPLKVDQSCTRFVQNWFYEVKTLGPTKKAQSSWVMLFVLVSQRNATEHSHPHITAYKSCGGFQAAENLKAKPLVWRLAVSAMVFRPQPNLTSDWHRTVTLCTHQTNRINHMHLCKSHYHNYAVLFHAWTLLLADIAVTWRAVCHWRWGSEPTCVVFLRDWANID